MNPFTEHPVIETFFLKVSDIHRIYIERVGNPEGSPILFVHGGPGGGITEKHRGYFDPQHYHMILFDQRGSGKSTPYAALEENTTWLLVEDMEKIRTRLGIDQWILFGGSWGSTLSLCYAIKHPQRVKALILRGIFLCRQEEMHWFYQEGADRIFPDAFAEFRNHIPPAEQGRLIDAYYRRLTSDDQAVRTAAARAWSKWEGSTVRLVPDMDTIHDFDEISVALARIECHYFVNHIFLESDNWILENTHRLKNIPCRIIHGRYDVVCPAKNAFDLKKALPHAELEIIADAGHAGSETGILNALIRATEDFKKY